MYITPMYWRLTTFLFRSGAPPMTLMTAGVLTDPQLLATASNVCTTDARLARVATAGCYPNKKHGYADAYIIFLFALYSVLGSAHQVFILHVLRYCASLSVLDCLLHVFSYNIAPTQFWSSIFLCPLISIFHFLIATSTSVFLSTCPNHLSFASLIFSRLHFPHLAFLLFLLFCSSQSSLFPSAISTFSSLSKFCSAFLGTQVSLPYIRPGLMMVLYTATLSVMDIFWSHTIPSIFLLLSHPDPTRCHFFAANLLSLLLSCLSHNFLPLACACLCPLYHCGQVVSRTGLV